MGTLIQVKNREAIEYVEYAKLSVKAGNLIAQDKTEARSIPVASVLCLLLGPGTSISQEAVKLLAAHHTFVAWTGSQGMRFYAWGRSVESLGNTLLKQVTAFADAKRRETIARRMFKLRFKEDIEGTIEELRGHEGLRVRNLYQVYAQRYGITWNGRNYDKSQWDNADSINCSISNANAILYAVTQAAVMSLGYSPDIGFVHVGRPLSFVYDMADLVKDVALQSAFQTESMRLGDLKVSVRDIMRENLETHKTVAQLITYLHHLFP